MTDSVAVRIGSVNIRVFYNDLLDKFTGYTFLLLLK